MRSLIGLVLCHLLPTVPATAPQTVPSTVRITVQLVDIRSAKGGVIHVGLHREPGTGFPGPSPFVNQDLKPLGSDASMTFEAPPGAYAIAVHHDQNSNGKLDTNFVGIPKEGYGVSNDARPMFSAPRFAAARVLVSRDTTLTVHIVY